MLKEAKLRRRKIALKGAKLDQDLSCWGWLCDLAILAFKSVGPSTIIGTRCPHWARTAPKMEITKRYRCPAVPAHRLSSLIASSNSSVAQGSGPKIESASSEFCFYLEHKRGANLDGLAWLLSETFEPENYSEASFLKEVRGLFVWRGVAQPARCHISPPLTNCLTCLSTLSPPTLPVFR